MMARLLHLPRRAARARTAGLLAAFDLEDPATGGWGPTPAACSAASTSRSA